MSFQYFKEIFFISVTVFYFYSCNRNVSNFENPNKTILLEKQYNDLIVDSGVEINIIPHTKLSDKIVLTGDFNNVKINKSEKEITITKNKKNAHKKIVAFLYSNSIFKINLKEGARIIYDFKNKKVDTLNLFLSGGSYAEVIVNSAMLNSFSKEGSTLKLKGKSKSAFLKAISNSKILANNFFAADNYAISSNYSKIILNKGSGKIETIKDKTSKIRIKK